MPLHMNKREKHPKHKDTQTSWGPVHEWYNEHLSGPDTYHSKVLLPNLIRLIEPKAEMHILDLACGQGFFAEHLSNKAQVIGVDISPELIAKAKTRVPKATFVVSPADELDFIKDQTIDHVLISLAIQNIARADSVFSEVARVLKTGGMFTMVLNHPAFRIPKRSSWQYDTDRHIQYRRIDAYLSESQEEIAMHPGVANSPTTISFHRPLQWYVKHLTKQGLLIDRVEEWTSHRTSVGTRAKAENTARKEFPLFLTLRAIKIPRDISSSLNTKSAHDPRRGLGQ